MQLSGNRQPEPERSLELEVGWAPLPRHAPAKYAVARPSTLATAYLAGGIESVGIGPVPLAFGG